MRKKIIYVLICLVALLIVLFTLSQGGDYTQKGIAQILIDETSDTRSQIEASLKSGSAPRIHKNFDQTQSKVEAISMLDDGTFVATSMRYKVVLLFKPNIVNGKLSWQCAGVPEAIVQVICEREWRKGAASQEVQRGRSE